MQCLLHYHCTLGFLLKVKKSTLANVKAKAGLKKIQDIISESWSHKEGPVML